MAEHFFYHVNFNEMQGRWLFKLKVKTPKNGTRTW